MSVDQEKAALRTEARTRRQQVHADAGVVSAQAIAADGLGFLGIGSDAVVSGYAAMTGELDPGPLLARLHERGVALALPVTIGKARPLVFRSWCPGDEMGAGFMGIAEPLATASEVEPDIILVPLLAFDHRGYRLGYGGGHYDRTLAGLRSRKTIVTVGIAFDEQRVDAVPQDRYDQQLDWILTPSGGRAFAS